MPERREEIELLEEFPELAATARLVSLREPRVECPADLGERIAAAVEAEIGESAAGTNGDRPDEGATERRARGRRHVLRWPRRLALAGAAAAVLALAVFAGTRIADDEGAELLGTLEVKGALTAPDGDRAGRVEVRALGIGREIVLRSGSFPILPKGEYYELWFVGAGDSLASPNRISAGTFHPDESGRSDVSFTAAVDPGLYPVVEVTAEPGDGDPAPSGDVVARLDSAD